MTWMGLEYDFCPVRSDFIHQQILLLLATNNQLPSLTHKNRAVPRAKRTPAPLTAATMIQSRHPEIQQLSFSF